MKLLSDLFQVDHTGAALKYQMELWWYLLIFRMTVTRRVLLVSKIC